MTSSNNVGSLGLGLNGAGMGVVKLLWQWVQWRWRARPMQKEARRAQSTEQGVQPLPFPQSSQEGSLYPRSLGQKGQSQPWRGWKQLRSLKDYPRPWEEITLSLLPGSQKPETQGVGCNHLGGPESFEPARDLLKVATDQPLVRYK